MRRANRERIYEAKLAGLHNRIVSEWPQSEDRADELLREWKSEASMRGKASALDAGRRNVWRRSNSI